MSNQTIEALDLSDLDLLDSDEQHIFCVCRITVGGFCVANAVCGKRAVCYGRLLEDIPDPICDDCWELADQPCPGCGE